MAAINLVLQLVVALCLFCHIPAVASLSSSSSPSSPLKGYHFGTSYTAATANSNAKKVTASDALRSGRQQSYVPDGLTLEQYAKIKNDELTKNRSKNFGAWGPRFQIVDGDPDSNWFNLPSLWTGGYNANNNLNNGKQKQQSESGRNLMGQRVGGMIHVLATCLRRNALAYMMLLYTTQLLLNRSLPSAKIFMSTPKWPSVGKTLLVPLATLKLLNLISRTMIEKRLMGEVEIMKMNGTTKLSAAVALLMGLVSIVLR